MTTEATSTEIDNDDRTMLVDDTEECTKLGNDWLVNLFALADTASLCEGTFDIEEQADENEAPDFDELRPCLDITLAGHVPADMDVVGSIVTASVGGGAGSTAKIDFEVHAMFVPDGKCQERVMRLILAPRPAKGDPNGAAFAALVGQSRMTGRPWFTEVATMHIASPRPEENAFFDLPNASAGFHARFEAAGHAS